MELRKTKNISICLIFLASIVGLALQASLIATKLSWIIAILSILLAYAFYYGTMRKTTYFENKLDLIRQLCAMSGFVFLSTFLGTGIMNPQAYPMMTIPAIFGYVSLVCFIAVVSCMLPEAKRAGKFWLLTILSLWSMLVSILGLAITAPLGLNVTVTVIQYIMVGSMVAFFSGILINLVKELTNK